MGKRPLGVPAFGGRAAGRGLRHLDHHPLTKVPAKDDVGSLRSFTHPPIHSFSGPFAARSRLSFRTGDAAGMHPDQAAGKEAWSSIDVLSSGRDLTAAVPTSLRGR